VPSADVSYPGAFIAGLLSFLSPCVLPLIPSYITYITGLSFADLQDGDSPAGIRAVAITHSLAFIAGFTTVFVLLGASATYLGSFLSENAAIVRKGGGILVILLGIHLTGLVPITALLGEKRVHIQRKPAGYFGSYLVGLAFAAGWTPCIGPILAAILMVAATEEKVWHGIVLLLLYSLGLGIPFLLSTIALEHFLTTFQRIKKYMRILQIITGIILILVGGLIFSNSLVKISGWLTMLMAKF
jgi:cytochrome c-type biogenesis protein